MSALPPKADIRQRELHVRYVPLPDIAPHAGTKFTPKRLFAMVPGQMNAK